MTTLFLATEADEGMGHIAPWTEFVAQAVGRGYEVHMAAPDVGMLQQLVGELFPIQVWSSPRLRSPHFLSRVTAPSVKSWPELLISLGYAHEPTLYGAVQAWRSILLRVRPAVVLADYAPALLLAAWTLDIPSLEVGNGFCIPPLAPQVQSFPGIKHQDAKVLAQANDQLTRAYNACLVQHGKLPIRVLGDVQAWPAARLVLSPPELDSYAPRTDVIHAGLLQAHEHAAAAAPATEWPPVVGYLKANTPGLDSLIDLMALARIHALVYVAGKKLGEHSTRGSVTLTDSPIPLAQALSQASVYLSNGGLSGLGQALRHGCWPVIVPQQAEQVATARNLLLRGWCSVWLSDSAPRSEQQTRELFAVRPRQPRLVASSQAEATLFQTIARLPERYVPPA